MALFDFVALPFEDPILVFAVAVTCFLVAPLVMERYRLPGIVGIIVVGALIGPNALGLLARGETIVLLGNVGIVYLMFLAGLEIDLQEFRDNRTSSIGFGFLSFFIPQAVGTVVGIYLLDFSVLTALLFASVFASHTLLAYPVVAKLGIGGNRAVTTAIGGTILTDVIALLILAVVAGAAIGEITLGFWVQLAVGVALFFGGTLFIVPRVGRWFFRNVNEESYFEYLFVIVVAYIAAYAADIAGLEAIIGAFLAGIALNPLITKSGTLMNRIEFVGNALFIPFFLLSVGMLVDLGVVLDGPETVIITAAMLAMVLTTKLGAAAVAGVLYEWSPDETATVFGLSVGQAAAALAVTLVGFEVGLFDDTVVNSVVLMILVISVVAPSVASRYGQRIAAAEAQTHDPSDAPQRILLPFSRNSEHWESLLDMAMLIRSPGSEESIYTVTVIEPNTEGTDEAIADIETKLEESTAHAASAEVPVNSRTRIDHNVAGGIATTAAENRISTIVIGWDGARTRSQNTFGTVIDHVLRRTDQLVFVTRVREPLNTTRRVVVVLPPDIDHNRGFHDAIRTITSVAGQLDAEVHAYTVGESADHYRTLLEAASPEAAVTVTSLDGWDGVYEMLDGDLGVDDFVVAMSSRRGRLGWHPELRHLPNRIATDASGNFAIVYPPVKTEPDDRRFLKFR